ncbi:MAG TPA: AsmA-like C-terminal region-containing protein [Chthoniobacterales bacterium]|nr:AsmA-like C-terminal region-containing protein [Chthoniobacterales bacterium]
MPPVIEPTPPSLARQFYRHRARSHHSQSRRVLRLSIVAFILIFGWTSWYLAKRGFGKGWRDRVSQELHKRGVEASIRRLTVDPVRGLIAQDVRIYDFKNRENTLAVISEVALDINYSALLHRKPFLNALDIRGADLTIPNPAAPGSKSKTQIKGLRAHVYFPPEQIYVSQAEGVFCGVRISATGQLIKRADYKPSGEISDEEWRQRLSLIHRAAEELRRFTFLGEAPSLQVKFAGDLSQFETLHAEATLRAERLQRGAYEISNVALAAEWANQTLTVTQCSWSDNVGNFSGRASWNRETKGAEFQGQSTLDAKRFLEAVGFPALLADVTLTGPPLLQISGAANFSGNTPALSLLGRVAVERFSYKTVPFLQLTADFSWDGARAMVRELRLRHESGELRGDVLDAPNDFRLTVDSAIDPIVFRAFTSPELGRFLAEWQWTRPPAIRLTIHGPSRMPETWVGEGNITTQRTRFRGAWMNDARAAVRLANGALTLADLHVTRDEGAGSGTIVYDFAHHEIRFKDIRASLRLTEAIVWVDPKYFKEVAPYKFRHPPSLIVNGVVHFRGPGDHIEIKVDAPTGMDYMFLGKNLPFDRVTGRLLFTDDRLQLLDMTAKLFNGDVRGGADISLAKNDNRYRANLALDGVDFPKLADLYFKHNTAHGRLSGTYEWTGLGSEARLMQGNGNARVTEGDIFAIPVFGPLSELLSAIIPGAGYSLARQAKSTFTIKEGVIHTDDFKVSGKLFGMVGHGDIHFLEDKLDFDIRIEAGGAGVVLTPMYKLFEYKGEGSISKPNWHPKRF